MDQHEKRTARISASARPSVKAALRNMARFENSNPSRVAERAIMAEAEGHPFFATLSKEDLARYFPWHPKLKNS